MFHTGELFVFIVVKRCQLYKQNELFRLFLFTKTWRGGMLGSIFTGETIMEIMWRTLARFTVETHGAPSMQFWC